MRTRTRGTGDKGIAVIMTALLLLPLMVFAAFGVDLASWYSRISYLQKSADAASLAGTVWMPDLSRATTEAKASLRENGVIDKDEGGVDDLDVVVERGSTQTALKVTITDNSATPYFSQVFRGDQVLSRSAEAEYNLPIPLGSPLNYFGGYAANTQPTQVFTYSVAWPTNYSSSSRPPINPSCNVGTSSSQGLGRWSNGTPPTYSASGFSGSTQCQWTVVGAAIAGPVVSVPPPDYTTRAPTNPTCRVRANGTAGGTVLGRWTSGSPATFSTSTSSTGNPPMCTWTPYATTASSIPSFAGVQTPTNRPCRVGYETSGAGGGFWPSSGGFQATSTAGGGDTNGNRLCRWLTSVVTTDTTPPNPIAANRNPQFWALIEGPGTVATQGDAYTPRCYLNANCGGVENATYSRGALPPAPDRGYWYVVKIPPGLSGSVDLQAFDASNNPSGSLNVLAGDSSINGSNQAFETEYRVYKQTNPIDFSARTPMTGGAGDTTPGSCYWRLGSQASFRGAWTSLCTVSGVTAGDVYLINVRTNGTTGSGINGYALQACANGSCTVGVQPSLYAFADMAMYNNIASGDATFYLAEVASQYAGKTLVIDLWDAGDASGDATIYPMRPSASLPKPVVNVPALDCAYTADPAPNVVQTSSPGGDTGVVYPATSPQASDEPIVCAIDSTIGGARQFNGEWLRIRISIPATYACTLGVNPETTAGSCWWGIKYNFTAAATDVTTWQARIEGNPVHLTL